MKHPDLEECPESWIDLVELKQASRLIGDVIKQAASRFYDWLGVPAEEWVRHSNGWLNKFKQTHRLQFHVFHGEASSAPEEDIDLECKRITTVLSSFLDEDRQRTLADVWNADEALFSYGAIPERSLTRDRRHGMKQSKTRLTLCFCCKL